ncbi:hypothetical protein SAMN05444008_10182 [Cnuella takakiae]|uniref:Uncharacterized protein n=1 Tax=Cnuella takakiae TaxID=1302690 RepID=A0A1M4SDB2_9BACT|nr:hypothetical protein [Cnuella takakiae]OLY94469.1 hypothetical protein BUE76_23270 [Cnuella takakiae]SHE30145.1 hypothetical protein SAMN05444008_10182 [Cnuella takakiae]
MRWVVVIVLSFVFAIGHAQNSDEWFKQKKTQLRYLAEQVAALKMYSAYIEQGYKVLHGGLTVISDVKLGEFSLHKDYFSGLSESKPDINSNWKIAALVLSAHQLLKLHKQSVATLISVKAVDPQFAKELNNAWTGVLAAVGNTLSELQLFTNSRALSIPDAARVSRIDQLLKQMQMHEAFAINLSTSASAILQHIKLEMSGNKTVRAMYRN